MTTDDTTVTPCESHRSLLWMPEWSRVVQIATDCDACEVVDP